MKTYCIFTEQWNPSVVGLKRCMSSAQKYNVKLTPFPAIHYSDMKRVQSENGIISKYTPVAGSHTNFVTKTAPRTRIANGTTHFLLYKKCVSLGEPIIILEHDSIFVDRPPFIDDDEDISNKIIQISSHTDKQLTPERLELGGRSKKMKLYGKTMKPFRDWGEETGILPHPLSGTQGTSGYIIGPNAAQKMIDYIKKDGVGFADRLREDHIGTNNLYLQVPQSVFCPNDITSTRM